MDNKVKLVLGLGLVGVGLYLATKPKKAVTVVTTPPSDAETPAEPTADAAAAPTASFANAAGKRKKKLAGFVKGDMVAQGSNFY